ncbi:hypothetical protein V5O48_017075 [Marasmius crinis-equi]|uniref:Uncharacterized protein n=1 Tax=Marasmius crinis-equi TaxID=585013 RepID=A0ABR3EQ02_9AGAR
MSPYRGFPRDEEAVAFVMKWSDPLSIDRHKEMRAALYELNSPPQTAFTTPGPSLARHLFNDPSKTAFTYTVDVSAAAATANAHLYGGDILRASSVKAGSVLGMKTPTWTKAKRKGNLRYMLNYTESPGISVSRLIVKCAVEKNLKPGEKNVMLMAIAFERLETWPRMLQPVEPPRTNPSQSSRAVGQEGGAGVISSSEGQAHGQCRCHERNLCVFESQRNTGIDVNAIVSAAVDSGARLYLSVTRDTYNNYPRTSHDFDPTRNYDAGASTSSSGGRAPIFISVTEDTYNYDPTSPPHS